MRWLRLYGVLVIGAAACNNTSGNVASTTTGDTTHLAERGSPVEDLRAACGDGAPTARGSSKLKRQPYLQQVTRDAAMLGWVTTDPVGAETRLSTDKLGALATARAVVEDYPMRAADENQMWS